MRKTKIGVNGLKKKNAMRKIVFMLASAMMLFACQKAVTDSTSATDKPDDKVVVGTVTLKALLPGFNDETKAGISDAGVFSWVDGENADVIAVRYTKAGEDDEYVEFTCTDASECEFTGNPTEGFTIATEGNIAFYPADYRGTPSAFSGSAANAPKSFQMTAKGFKDGKLAFEHDNALLKVSINNIPSIADNIVIGYESGYSTVNISEGGDLTVMVPAIASNAGSLHIYVKRGDQVLFTKGTSKGVEIKKGYLYTHIPTLTVAPSGVFLKSSMTNWSEDEVAPMATTDNINYTISLQSVGDQYAKVYVEYPGEGTPVWFRMGTGTGSDSESIASNDLVVDNDHSVHIANLDSYDFAYNIITGNFTIESTGDPFNLYIRGGLNSWAYDDAKQLTAYEDGNIYYYVGRFSGEQKLYYNHFDMSQLAASSKASSGTLVKETGSSAVLNVDADYIYYEVIDLAHMTFKIQGVSNSTNSGAVSSFGIKGAHTGGEKSNFTSPCSNTWVGIQTMSAGDWFQFWDNNTEAYGNDDNWPDETYVKWEDADPWRYQIKKDGTYLFVIHLDNWVYYVELLDNEIAGNSLGDYNNRDDLSIVWDD